MSDALEIVSRALPRQTTLKHSGGEDPSLQAPDSELPLIRLGELHLLSH